MYGALVEDLYDALQDAGDDVDMAAWKAAVDALGEDMQVTPAQSEAYFNLMDAKGVRYACFVALRLLVVAVVSKRNSWSHATHIARGKCHFPPCPVPFAGRSRIQDYPAGCSRPCIWI